MSFESHIDRTLADLRSRRRMLEHRQLTLLHDCNCDLCENVGEVMESELPEWNEINKDIKAVDKTIKSVEAHKKLHAKYKGGSHANTHTHAR